MNIPAVGKPKTLAQFIEEITFLCQHGFNVTGIAVVLSVDNGECITTHQFGMTENDLAIAGQLMTEYSTGSVVNHSVN
jgi:hypothetical protein